MRGAARAGGLLAALVATSCATPEPPVVTAPQPVVPAVSPQERDAQRRAAQANLGAEAKALLAQAETDVQRARAKRALWLPAWEDLLAARQALADNDFALAIARARRASEFAQLGLEQLAYPAVK